MTPVVGSSKLKSPDGELEFDSMSGLERNFARAPTGNTGELPPKRFASYLLKGWREDHPGVSVKVVALQDVPVAIRPGQVPQGIQARMVRGLVKLTYRKAGKTYLVKTQATMLAGQSIPTQTPFGGEMYEGGWLIGDFYQVSAPEARLPEAMKVAGIVLTSSRQDPHWFSLVAKVQQQISQAIYSGVAAAGRMSQIISQTNDAISDSIMSSYSANQTAEDESVQGFDDYIRGIDRYQDNDGRVGLPSGYSHAWKDDQGNYLVTDDHLYDPNVSGPGGTWHELERVP
jgi:hypothetical protein